MPRACDIGTAFDDAARADDDKRPTPNTPSGWLGRSYAPLTPRSAAQAAAAAAAPAPVAAPVTPPKPAASAAPAVLTSKKSAPARVDILNLIDSPKIFGAWFKPRDSWFSWRVAMAAAYGIHPSRTGDEKRARDLYTACTARTKWPADRSKIVAICAGQRSGKSRMSALNAVALSTLTDYSKFLSPGERGHFPVISADRRQAQVALGYAKAFTTGSEIFKQMLVDDGDLKEKLIFSNSIDLEVMTGSFRTTRGYTNVGAIFDEIAYYRSDDANANPDHEIVNAIRRGMRTIPTSMAFAISSPYARSGQLWDWYKQHWGKEDSSILFWKAPTWVMNLTITREDLEEEFQADPAKATADYGAEFRTDVEKFVRQEVIDACTMFGVHEIAPRAANQYIAVVDPSGGSADGFTLAIGHREDELIFIDLVEERLPPFSPDSVVDEFAERIRPYELNFVKGDRYAGEWPAERFSAHHVAYEPLEKAKSDLYRDALPMMNSHRVRMVDNAKLRKQFIDLERRTTRGGKDTIDHPANGHDDLANAVAGVISELSDEFAVDLTW